MPSSTLIVTPADVLTFWFGAYPLDAAAMARVQDQWFAKSDAFDAEIGARFGATIAAARTGALDGWAATPEGWLALLVVLDQFTRNVCRGQPEAFASDGAAQRLALAGLARGDDQALPPKARVFTYLPLEHAEDAALQAQSVSRFTALLAAAPAGDEAYFQRTLDFAHAHQDVIARFGRFPHRNAALGRESTAAERDYLAQPGAGF